MNHWHPYANEREWWQGQLENHVNEDECEDCGCEYCEDELNPETGLCVHCEERREEAARQAEEFYERCCWEMPAFRAPGWARRVGR